MYNDFFQVFKQPQPSFSVGPIFESEFKQRRPSHRRINNVSLLQKFPDLFNQQAELKRRETFYNHLREQKTLKKQKRKDLLEKKRRAEAQKQREDVISSLFNFFQDVEEDDSYHSDSTSLADIVNNSDEEEEKSTTVIHFTPNNESDDESDNDEVSTTIIQFTPNQNTLTYNEDCEMSETGESDDSDENEFTASSDDDDQDDDEEEITDSESSDSSEDDIEIEEASDSDVEFEFEASAEDFTGFSSEDEDENTVELDSLVDALNNSASVIENSINIFERLNRHSNSDYSDKESTSSSDSSSGSKEALTEALILRSRIQVLENLRLELETQYNKLDSLENPADADLKRFKHVLIGKAAEFADKSEQLANTLKKRVASIKGNFISSFENELEGLEKAHSSETESESEEEQFSDSSSSSDLSKPAVRRILIETLSDAALSD